MESKSLLIGALLVAVLVLGFLYYQSEKNDVEVDIGAASGVIAAPTQMS